MGIQGACLEGTVPKEAVRFRSQEGFFFGGSQGSQGSRALVHSSKFNSTLKNGAWKIPFLLGETVTFQGRAVSFKEGNLKK